MKTLAIAIVTIGLAAGAQAPAIALTFTDWTSIDDPASIATGTLGGVSVMLSGGDIDAPFSVTDGTSTRFNSSLFTPPLTATDVISIRGGSPAFTYTVTIRSRSAHP